MAQMFNILDWRKNHDLNRYFAQIDFNDCVGNYEIRTNANIRYLDWLEDDLKLSILDGQDRPFNEELPYLEIKGLVEVAKKNEKSLKMAFIEFIKQEFSEKRL